MARKKNKKQIDRDLKIFVFDKIYNTGVHLIKAFKWITLGYFAFRSIKVLAGKSTNLDAILQLSLDTYDNVLLCACVLSIVWAFGERSFRQRKTKQLSARIAKLELEIDPNRTSSNLNNDGNTNPLDR